MTLTDNMIKYGYFVAGKLVGRRNIDHQDIAHEAFCRALRRTKPVPEQYHNRYIALTVRSVFREFYTHKTARKHDIMLDAVHDFQDYHLHKFNHESEIDVVDSVVSFAKELTRGQRPVLIGRLAGASFGDMSNEQGRNKKAVYQTLRNIRKRIGDQICTAS